MCGGDGATKAFLLHWSLALGEELRGSGVKTLAVCPGTTATEFFRTAGLKPGRESDAETNLFWHRGLSLSDIALGAAMLEKAKRLGAGQTLRYR